MVLFGLALGILELIALALFVVFLCLGTAFDRRGHESFKWWVLFIGIVVLAALNLSSISFAGIWESITSASLWKTVGLYALVGLGYSMVEFFLHVRRAARATASSWADFIQREDTWAFHQGGEPAPEELAVRVENGVLKATYAEMFKHGSEFARIKIVQQFTSHFRSNDALIKINSNSGHPIPVVDKGELASYIGAWTTFWPFYAISLILGDLLEEVWNIIASIVAKISGRFVRMAFADVFKV